MTTDGLGGFTSMAAGMALVTIRLAVPATEPRVAVIVVFPGLIVLARPLLGGELLAVATSAAEELQ